MWKHLVITLLVFSSLAAKEKFFDKAKEGWFYYEEPKTSRDNNDTDEDRKFIASIPLDNLEAMSAKDFRETLDRVRDISVMKPTYENIMAYKRMTKFATDKSEKFAVNYKLASIIDDSYEYHDIGTGGFTNNALKDEREKTELAKHLTENVVFVTFTKDPNGTLAQKQILANINMRRDYGVDTRTIALADFPEMEKRLGIANEVENFVYYKKQQKWQRIRRGLIDGDTFVKDFIFFEKNKGNFKLDEELSL